MYITDADVAELADALDLGSSSERSEGSSPFIRIVYYTPFAFVVERLFCDYGVDEIKD